MFAPAHTSAEQTQRVAIWLSDPIKSRIAPNPSHYRGYVHALNDALTSFIEKCNEDETSPVVISISCHGDEYGRFLDRVYDGPGPGILLWSAEMFVHGFKIKDQDRPVRPVFSGTND